MHTLYTYLHTLHDTSHTSTHTHCTGMYTHTLHTSTHTVHAHTTHIYTHHTRSSASAGEPSTVSTHSLYSRPQVTGGPVLVCGPLSSPSGRLLPTGRGFCRRLRGCDPGEEAWRPGGARGRPQSTPGAGAGLEPWAACRPLRPPGGAAAHALPKPPRAPGPRTPAPRALPVRVLPSALRRPSPSLRSRRRAPREGTAVPAPEGEPALPAEPGAGCALGRGAYTPPESRGPCHDEGPPSLGTCTILRFPLRSRFRSQPRSSAWGALVRDRWHLGVLSFLHPRRGSSVRPLPRDATFAYGKGRADRSEVLGEWGAWGYRRCPREWRTGRDSARAGTRRPWEWGAGVLGARPGSGSGPRAPS